MIGKRCSVAGPHGGFPSREPAHVFGGPPSTVLRATLVICCPLWYLQAPTPSQIYVSEVFKVVGGRIVRIDNVGVMMTGVTSLGFVH